MKVDHLTHYKEMLARAIERNGEDAPSVKDLKRQIAAMEYQQETGQQTAQQMFVAHGRGQPSADPDLQRLTEEAYNNAHEAIQNVVSPSEQTDESPSPTGQPQKD